MDWVDRKTLSDRLKELKPWYLLVITLVAGIVCIVALRANNLEMVSLRNQVYSADKNNGDVIKALQNLQVYVNSHMNTDLSTGPNAPYPPIQLEYSYDRAVEATGSTANSDNTQLYTNAQNYCQSLDPTDFSGHNRVPCIQQYVESHGVKLPNIPVILYEFDFISPALSPDLAGWSLVVTIVSFLSFAVLWSWQRLTDHRH
ncbi:MAG: hypothetical protein ACREF5_01875 [Candidatus Saccharimonadales bacterium]